MSISNTRLSKRAQLMRTEAGEGGTSSFASNVVLLFFLLLGNKFQRADRMAPIAIIVNHVRLYLLSVVADPLVDKHCSAIPLSSFKTTAGIYYPLYA